MDKLQTILKMILRDVSVGDILDNSINLSYNNFTEEDMRKIANSYLKQYSNNEISNMHSYLVNEFNRVYSHMTRGALKESDRINIFDPIFIFSNYVLLDVNGVPLCRYEHFLRWRMMSHALDGDIFITAFFAYKDVWDSSHRRDFLWRPSIGHNNTNINRIMEKGLVDNHFHLKGSAPYFALTWNNMMNDICNQRFKNILDKYSYNRLSTKHQNSAVSEESLYVQWMQAVIIRLFLFSKLTNQPLKFENYHITSRDILQYCKIKAINDTEHVPLSSFDGTASIKKLFSKYISKDDIYTHAVIELCDKEFKLDNKFFQSIGKTMLSVRDIFVRAMESDRYVRLDSLRNIFSEDMYYKILDSATENFVRRMIAHPYEIEIYKTKIQNCINTFKGLSNYWYDYAYFENNADVINYIPNKHLAGERWFMYSVFRRVCSESLDIYPYLNLFYAYLVIKENIRAELIQLNSVVGFDNFRIYQDRKEDFIDYTSLEKDYLTIAIRDTLENQNIVCIEARIAPRRSAYENAQYIRKLDRIITRQCTDATQKETLKEKYFYVFHFIKEDDVLNSEFGDVICRYEQKRKEIKKQALAIAGFRNRYQALANRVLGIDAANLEINCRPEVFAQAFRFLRNHVVNFGEHKLEMLGVTYHVGEDFLDVIDGLRAIDEAILFLNMKCGDRLGHALALGVDVRKWYESKSNNILISQQAYLDNIVWLYMAIIHYGVSHTTDVLEYLEQEFNKYAKKIYWNNMQNTVIYTSSRPLDEKERIKFRTDAIYNIHVYYNAWKLRGDNPKYYIDGYLKRLNDNGDIWNQYAINMEYPHDTTIRNDNDAAYIYHSYHYNQAVKEEGSQNIEVKMPHFIINIVEKVQKAMQHRVARLGLYVETNPSSNYLIGTFGRYDEHPIRTFYNLKIAKTSEELENCPQISACINTDDQGVFDTCLESEYALLALGLEKMCNNDGSKVYNKAMIYEWLDQLREKGHEACFKRLNR